MHCSPMLRYFCVSKFLAISCKQCLNMSGIGLRVYQFQSRANIREHSTSFKTVQSRHIMRKGVPGENNQMTGGQSFFPVDIWHPKFNLRRFFRSLNGWSTRVCHICALCRITCVKVITCSNYRRLPFEKQTTSFSLYLKGKLVQTISLNEAGCAL